VLRARAVCDHVAATLRVPVAAASTLVADLRAAGMIEPAPVQ